MSIIKEIRKLIFRSRSRISNEDHPCKIFVSHWNIFLKMHVFFAFHSLCFSSLFSYLWFLSALHFYFCLYFLFLFDLLCFLHVLCFFSFFAYIFFCRYFLFWVLWVFCMAFFFLFLVRNLFLKVTQLEDTKALKVTLCLNLKLWPPAKRPMLSPEPKLVLTAAGQRPQWTRK